MPVAAISHPVPRIVTDYPKRSTTTLGPSSHTPPLDGHRSRRIHTNRPQIDHHALEHQARVHLPTPNPTPRPHPRPPSIPPCPTLRITPDCPPPHPSYPSPPRTSLTLPYPPPTTQSLPPFFPPLHTPHLPSVRAGWQARAHSHDSVTRPPLHPRSPFMSLRFSRGNPIAFYSSHAAASRARVDGRNNPGQTPSQISAFPDTFAIAPATPDGGHGSNR